MRPCTTPGSSRCSPGFAVNRGRLDAAEAALRSARDEIAELADPGKTLFVLEDVGRELGEARSRASAGEVLELPTAAELAVLRLLASDLSVRQIGSELFLSPNTIRSHTRALYRKFGVNSRVDAVARADAARSARPNGITHVIAASGVFRAN